MFCNYQLVIVGIVLLCIGYLVIYGSSSEGFREGITGNGGSSAGSCPPLPTAAAWLNLGYAGVDYDGRLAPMSKKTGIPICRVADPPGQSQSLNMGDNCLIGSRGGIASMMCAKCIPAPPDRGVGHPVGSPFGLMIALGSEQYGGCTSSSSSGSCTLPSTLGAGVVPGASPACSGGGTLAGGTTCNVKCDTGYSGSGTTSYSCSSGGNTGQTLLTPASLKCTPNVSPGPCSSGTRTYSKVVCDKTHSSCSGYDQGCYAGYLIGVNNLGGDAATLQAAAKKACDATPDCTHINTSPAAGGYYQMWGGGRECTPDEYKMHAGSRLKPLWYSRIVTPMGPPGNLYKANDDRTCDSGCQPETTTTTVDPYGQYGKMHQTKGDSGGGGGAYAGGGDDKKTQCSTYSRGCWNASGHFPTPKGGVVSAAPGGLAQYSQSSSVSNTTCVHNICICPGGTPVTGAACKKNKAEQCASCKPGYILQPDGTCVHNVCTCPGGTPATGAACNASGIHCVTCNPNYHLEGSSCVINKCTCPNGSPATVCTTDGEIKCSACAIGHYLDSNNKCSPNALCSSINACPPGRQFKQNYNKIRCGGGTCKDAECCDPIPQPTCIDFSCPTYSSIIKNAKGKICAGKACTDDECCTQNPKPTCYGDDIKCPPDYYLKSNAQKIQCSDYTCQSSECCSPNPTCDTMQCAPGFTGKGASTICKGATCSNTECCTQNSSCSSFACPPDYISNPHPAQAGCIAPQCTINECCILQPPKPPPPHKSTIINEEEDINIYFPGATFITFDGEKNTNNKQDPNSDIYNYSKYDNWTTPYQTKSYQTNNMFSTIPVKTAATGISAFNTTSYNQA